MAEKFAPHHPNTPLQANGQPKTPFELPEYFTRPFIEDQNEGFKPPSFLTNPDELSQIKPPKSVKTLEQRLSELSDEERKKLDIFREKVKGADWYEEKYMDDWMLIRYLVARQFNLDKALEMLHNSAKWRAEEDRDAVRCKRCDQEKNSHMMQFVGWDKEHRPVLYTSYRWAQNRGNAEEGKMHSLETFNHAVSLMPEGVEQWVCVTDFVSYSHWSDGKPAQGIGVIKMMQDHFPERLCQQILIDPPTTFWVLYKAFSPFIDAKTKTKVKMYYTTAKPNIEEEFPLLFPPHLSEYLIKQFHDNKDMNKK